MSKEAKIIQTLYMPEEPVLDAKLITACNAISDWCHQTTTPYDIVYDEDDTQGILIFKRDKSKLPRLLYAVRESLSGLHLRQVPVRAGTIILMSIEAINEHEFTQSLGDLAVTDEFALKVKNIFDGELAEDSPTEPAKPTIKDRLMQSAKDMWESQYKWSSSTAKRAGSLYAFKSSRVKGHGDGEDPDGGSAEGTPEQDDTTTTVTKVTKGTKTEYRSRLDAILELAPPGGAVGLQGLGAEHQPGDLFQRFAQAMQALGTALHLGAPLQDLLKRQGISWKKSEDAQSVIFYVKNAATNAPQPIARVGYQTLGKPQEFQAQLMNVLDIAKGQAPGTEQQKYEEAQEAQKQMRDLAQQFAPPQQGQGAPGAPGAGGAIAPPTAPAAAPAAAPAKPAAPAAAKPGPAKPVAKPMAKPAAKPVAKPAAKTGGGQMIHTPR